MRTIPFGAPHAQATFRSPRTAIRCISVLYKNKTGPLLVLWWLIPTQDLSVVRKWLTLNPL